MVLEKYIIRIIITMSTGITELSMIGMIDILSSDESWTASSRNHGGNNRHHSNGKHYFYRRKINRV